MIYFNLYSCNLHDEVHFKASKKDKQMKHSEGRIQVQLLHPPGNEGLTLFNPTYKLFGYSCCK